MSQSAECNSVIQGGLAPSDLQRRVVLGMRFIADNQRTSGARCLTLAVFAMLAHCFGSGVNAGANAECD